MSFDPGRFPSKEIRKRHELLVEFGYEPVRYSGGHLVYFHPSAAPFHLAMTPRMRGHSGKGFLAELRRRHPDAPLFKRVNGHKPRSGVSRKAMAERDAARTRANLRAAIRAVPKPAEVPIRLDYDGCPECGYRWQSPRHEIPDPEGRPCPTRGCTGYIALGVKPTTSSRRRTRQPWEPKEAA